MMHTLAEYWGVIMIALIIIAAFVVQLIRDHQFRKGAMTRQGAPKIVAIERDRPEIVPPGLDRDIRRSLGQKIAPQKGDRRWSRYFDGYVELVDFESDARFHFKPIDSRRFPETNGQVLRNQSTWSALALRKPDDWRPND
jgi:hypothetical protein